MKGKFITLEGCEGAGKSAQSRLLAEYFTKNNIDFILTREPGGTDVAEKIRGIILDTENKSMSYECEALLYAAARADHISNKIIPALNEGKIVLCDRFLDSSLAYQAYARELGTETVEKANFFAYEKCMPDVTLFLDISPADAFKRKGGVDKTDRIELEGMAFHTKVYEGYLALADKYPDRFIKIPCMGNKYQTHENIINTLKQKGILK